MAVDLEDEYPGRMTPADANYPYSSGKDETSPGAGDGSPYKKARADDLLGFQQSLLIAAGIIPSGNADTVLESQYMQSLVELISGRAQIYTVSGVVNVYILDVGSNQHPPKSYFNGFTIRFSPNITNTLATTVNVEGLGAVSLRKGSNELGQGAIVPGESYVAVYDSDGFQLIPSFENINVQTSGAGNSSLGINVFDNADTLHQHVSQSIDNLHRFTNLNSGITDSDGFAVGLLGSSVGILWIYEAQNIIIGTDDQTRIIINADGGIHTPLATGDSQGADTINAGQLFVNGVEILPAERFQLRRTATQVGVPIPSNATSVTIHAAGGGGGGGGGGDGGNGNGVDGSSGGNTTITVTSGGVVTTITSNGGAGGQAGQSVGNGNGGALTPPSSTIDIDGVLYVTAATTANGVGGAGNNGGNGGGGQDDGAGGVGSATDGVNGLNGGGGAGGGGQDGAGAGGGSSSNYVTYNVALVAGATIDITVGTGGAGGTGYAAVQPDGGIGGVGYVTLEFNS